jgi:protease YdgD
LLGFKTAAVLVGVLASTVSAIGQVREGAAKISGLAQGDVIATKDYPWSAIGKLNNGVGGSCTAVLISEKYALTAAHCLIFRSTGRYLPAESLHLVLGYEKQQYREHYYVAAYYVPPDYQPHHPYETLANDWALLSLAPTGPARTQPLALTTDHDISRVHLMTAGYSHGTPYAMTADQNCKVIGQSHDHSFLFDSCKAPAGYSGSPVIVRSADRSGFAVAAIHVANQLWQTNTIAVAIPMEAIWPRIRNCVEGGRCAFQVVAHGHDPTAAEVLSGLPKLGYRNVVSPSPTECVGGNSACTTTLTAEP